MLPAAQVGRGPGIYTHTHISLLEMMLIKENYACDLPIANCHFPGVIRRVLQ